VGIYKTSRERAKSSCDKDRFKFRFHLANRICFLSAPRETKDLGSEREYIEQREIIPSYVCMFM